MGWSVVIAVQAKEDLADIVQFIARNNPARARTFGNALVDKALSLAELPERGRVVPGQDNADIREIMHGAYRIVYQVVHGTEMISILRFWHGARGEPEIPME